MKPTEEELLRNLAGFTGTEHYYNYGALKLTDGIKYMADNCHSYWLLDAICSYQPELKGKPSFQIWKLEVKDSKAILTMQEDSDQPILVRQDIDFTDFPLPEIELWLIDGVLILPSEY
jgi:hypothetical protein